MKSYWIIGLSLCIGLTLGVILGLVLADNSPSPQGEIDKMIEEKRNELQLIIDQQHQDRLNTLKEYCKEMTRECCFLYYGEIIDNRCILENGEDAGEIK